jgi:hypothetical protein
MEAGDRAMQGAIAERMQSKKYRKLTTIPHYQDFDVWLFMIFVFLFAFFAALR